MDASNTFTQTQASLVILRQVQTHACLRLWGVSVNIAYLSFTTEPREHKHEKYICIKTSRSVDEASELVLITLLDESPFITSERESEIASKRYNHSNQAEFTSSL